MIHYESENYFKSFLNKLNLKLFECRNIFFDLPHSLKNLVSYILIGFLFITIILTIIFMQSGM